MNGQIQQVETYLGDMGRRCNARLLEKKGSNLRTWDGAVGTAGIDCHEAAIPRAIEGLIASGRHRALYLCIPIRRPPQLSRGLVEATPERGFGIASCKGARHFEAPA